VRGSREAFGAAPTFFAASLEYVPKLTRADRKALKELEQ